MEKIPKMQIFFFFLPSLLFILLLCIYPLIYTINLSFKDVSLVNYIRGEMKFVGLSNYINLINDFAFKRTFFNNLFFTFCSIVFQYLIGFCLAILLSKDLYIKNFLQGLIMLPWVIPIIVSGSFFRWFFSDDGILNGFLAYLRLINSPIHWLSSEKLPIISATIANIWLGIPFNFILLYTGIAQIPNEVLESAEIDGASEWKKIIYIIFPMLKPVTITLLLLGTIFTMKVFDLVWVLTQGGPGDTSHLFSTLAYTYAFKKLQFGYASATLVIMLLIICLLILSLNMLRKEE